jgi:tetratricopeptide (TPR) repeat protein
MMLHGEYGLAVQTLRDSLSHYKKSPQITGLTDYWIALDALRVIRNLGDSYVQEKEFTFAKSMCKKALNLQFSAKEMQGKNEQLGLGVLGLEPQIMYLISNKSIGDTYLRISNMCFLSKQHNEALDFLSDALMRVFGYTTVKKQWKSDVGNRVTNAHSTLARILYFAAEVYVVVGHYDSVIALYENASQIHNCSDHLDASEHGMFSALCSFGIANVYCRCLDYRKALNHFNKIVNFDSITDFDILDVVKLRRAETVKKVEVMDLSETHLADLIRLEEKLDLFRKIGDSNGLLLAYLNSVLTSQKMAIDTLNQAGLNAKPEIYALVHILQQIEKAFDFQGDSEGSNLAREDSIKLLDQLMAIGSFDDFVVNIVNPNRSMSISIYFVGCENGSPEHEFLEL